MPKVGRIEAHQRHACHRQNSHGEETIIDTSAPHSIADVDIARLRRHYSDHETAEIVYVVCASNFFDRFTETLGLKSDD